MYVAEGGPIIRDKPSPKGPYGRSDAQTDYKGKSPDGHSQPTTTI